MNKWQILGLSPTTDRKTIKRAYIKLIKQYHPEDHPEKFQEIRDAYEAALQWAVSENSATQSNGHDESGNLSSIVTDASLFDGTGIGNPSMDRLDDLNQDPVGGNPLETGQGAPIPGTIEIQGAPRHRFPVIADAGDAHVDTSWYGNKLDDSPPQDGLPAAMAQISDYLSAHDQDAAIEIFRQELTRINHLSDRLHFSKALYGILADMPDLPMAFTQSVVEHLNWDVQSAQSLDKDNEAAGDIFNTYVKIRKLKQALDGEGQFRLKTLRKKQSRLRIALQAMIEQRREYIQQWVEALLPYAPYYDYLGIDPRAVAAWQDELGRPQFPAEDELDNAYSLLIAIGYAYYAVKYLSWSVWLKWGAGIAFYLVICIVILYLPVVRWVVFKWREDWRPGANCIISKFLLDIIPLGLMALFGAVSAYAFPTSDNPGTYALFTFLPFLLGLNTFILLSIISAFYTAAFLMFFSEFKVIFGWLIVCSFWLKIKLTVLDNFGVSAKTAGRLGYAGVGFGYLALTMMLASYTSHL